VALQRKLFPWIGTLCVFLTSNITVNTDYNGLIMLMLHKQQVDNGCLIIIMDRHNSLYYLNKFLAAFKIILLLL
jgi:hypothetical protein